MIVLWTVFLLLFTKRFKCAPFCDFYCISLAQERNINIQNIHNLTDDDGEFMNENENEKIAHEYDKQPQNSNRSDHCENNVYV